FAFLFSSPPTSAPCTLSLHDALPISSYRFVEPTQHLLLLRRQVHRRFDLHAAEQVSGARRTQRAYALDLHAEHLSRLRLGRHLRSEEHTSELQSRENLVCRLLLEKKK